MVAVATRNVGGPTSASPRTVRTTTARPATSLTIDSERDSRLIATSLTRMAHPPSQSVLVGEGGLPPRPTVAVHRGKHAEAGCERLERLDEDLQTNKNPPMGWVRQTLPPRSRPQQESLA